MGDPVESEEDTLRIFTVGTVYRALLDDNQEYVPCVPVPGTFHATTRILKNEIVVCTGTHEFGDQNCVEFMIGEDRVLVGIDTASRYLSKIGMKGRHKR